MLEQRGLHWQDLYENFVNKFNIIDTLRKDNSVPLDELTESYAILFNATCKMLKVYLANKGLFQRTYDRILKICYQAGIIDNGQDWVNALFLIEHIARVDAKDMVKLYCQDEFFQIYVDLKNKMEGMLSDE